MTGFYLLFSTVIAECCPLLHDNPFLQVVVVELCLKSCGAWGLVPDGGKELCWASQSCCLKICTNCIGYALLMISSWFSKEELGFFKRKVEILIFYL